MGRGRLDEADDVVSDMERAAAEHGQLAAPAADVPVDAHVGQGTVPFRELSANPTYLRRILLLVTVWFVGYVTV